MNTDQKAGAGAYKSDAQDASVVRVDSARTDETARGATETSGKRDFKAPFHLNISKDREVKLDYRQTAIAAGALGLGYLAFKGVSRLIGQGAKKNAVAAGHTGKLEAVPMAEQPRPEVKDNAMPRFVGEAPNRVDEPVTPFVAASTEDDTADLVEGMTETEVVAAVTAHPDRSNETAEHVPTDLMADRDPGSQDRAIDAFRPDPTAPVPEGMRDSLRPATGPATGFAANRGTFAQGLSQTDGSK